MSNKFYKDVDEIKNVIRKSVEKGEINQDMFEVLDVYLSNLSSQVRHPDTEMVVNVISNFVNCFGSREDEFTKLMSREHRTLQQNFTRFCIAWFKYLAEEKYYDLRNEDSIKLAKELKPILDELGYLRHV